VKDGHGGHLDALLALLGESDEARRFRSARTILRETLVMTRDTPIGRDYLFAGSPGDIRDALRAIIAIEHRHDCGLHLDYALVEDYVLLRIVGGEELREVILGYFDPV
jgi:hypothetical protein